MEQAVLYKKYTSLRSKIYEKFRKLKRAVINFPMKTGEKNE
jgi:hypothetical protein